jgi:hypothetical protein
MLRYSPCRVDYTPEMMKEPPKTDWKETRVWGNCGGVVQNSTGVGPLFGIYAGIKCKAGKRFNMEDSWCDIQQVVLSFQNIGKGLVALEEAQRETNRKALKGERRTEKRSVPYLYRWAGSTGSELNLRLLRTYEVNRGRSCGYICFSETIDTIYNQCLGT